MIGMLNLCYMGLSENGLYTTNYINNWWKIWTPSAVGFSVNMEVSSNGTPIAGWCVSMKIHENPWKCMKMHENAIKMDDLDWFGGPSMEMSIW